MTTVETSFGLAHFDDSLGIPVFGAANAFEDPTPRPQTTSGPEVVEPPEIESASTLYQKWGVLLPVSVELVSPESE